MAKRNREGVKDRGGEGFEERGTRSWENEVEREDAKEKMRTGSER